MRTYSSVRTFAAGDRLRSFWLNTFIRDNQLALRGSPSCRVRLVNVAQSIPDSVYEALDFNEATTVVDRNDGGIWGGTSKFTLPIAGVWLISARARIDNGATDFVSLRARWNDSTGGGSKPGFQTVANAGGVFDTVVGGSIIAYVPTAGEFFEIEVAHKGAGTELDCDFASVNVRLLGGVATAPAWTTPRTWIDGETLTAALFNTHIRDDHNFLYYRPGAAIGLQANSAITTATWTVVPFSASANVWFDNGPIWSSATPTRLTPGIAGRWTIAAGVTFAGNSTGERAIGLRFNGVAQRSALAAGKPASTFSTELRGMTEITLSATDYVELDVYQASGGNLNVARGVSTYGDGTWLAAIFAGS